MSHRVAFTVPLDGVEHPVTVSALATNKYSTVEKGSGAAGLDGSPFRGQQNDLTALGVKPLFCNLSLDILFIDITRYR